MTKCVYMLYGFVYVCVDSAVNRLKRCNQSVINQDYSHINITFLYIVISHSYPGTVAELWCIWHTILETLQEF